MVLEGVNMDTIGFVARIIQTAATNTFFGAAFYVNMVETPARKSLKSASAVVDHFQATFPRAKNIQGKLAATTSITGFLSWFTDNSADRYLLVAAWGCMFIMWPWTILAIKPVNDQLMDGEAPKKKGDTWVQSMMTKWDRLHGVRTTFSCVSAICLATYWIKKSL